MESFEHALTTLINQFSQEKGSDTPDFLLAEYLKKCLDNWNEIVVAREKWYGRKCGNGVAILGESKTLESPSA